MEEIDKIEGEFIVYRDYNEKDKDIREEKLATRKIDRKYDDIFKVFKDVNGNLFLRVTPQKGNNIVIKCKNAEELGKTIEKIQLNIEKARIDDGEYRIGATSEKRCEITGGEKHDDPSIKEKIEQKKQEQEELGEEYDGLLASKEYKRLDKEIEKLESNQNKYLTADIDKIVINGKRLEETDKVAEYLLEKANISKDEDNKIIDFNSQNYGNEVQTYLSKYLYSEEISLSDEQKEALQYYKKAGFKQMNAFTRGDFDKVENGSRLSKTIKDMTKCFLIIDEIAKKLPTRKYDIVLNRQETGQGKDTEIGSENVYDRLVSFGTNNGTHIGERETTTIYKRILRKEEPSIPMDLVLQDTLFLDGTECEFVTFPFSYKVSDYEKQENSDISYITMGDIKERSLIDLVKRRLEEFKEYESSKPISEKDKIADIEESLTMIKETQAKNAQDKDNRTDKFKQEPVKPDKSLGTTKEEFEKKKEKNGLISEQERSINPDKLLEKTIKESREKGSLLKIESLVIRIKRKIREFLNPTKEGEKDDRG